jgi:hypothetical protein
MFYALKNLRSQITFEVERPWDVWQDYPNPAYIGAKDELEAWRAAAKTEHMFISPFRGQNSKARITEGKKNPELMNCPHEVCALIADYDAACTQVHIDNINAKPAQPDYMPHYICNTFRPGYKRLIWLFEKPILLGGTYTSAAAFMKKVASEIKADLWLPGFDDNCLKPHMYFAVGTNWTKISDAEPIPSHILYAWAAVADSTVNFTNEYLSPPPLEKVADLVAERFPGRWSGPFGIGSRGVRFWDPQADNPTAAVVMPEGMRCFTEPSGFVTWRDIFGSRAVDELQGEQFEELKNTIAFDGERKRYWYEYEGKWSSMDKGDFAEYLVACGMDNRKPKTGGLSRVASFMNTIRIKYNVKEALPFVYMPSGRIFYNGSYSLNTSSLKPMPPAPPLHGSKLTFAEAGQQSFPWIYAYMSTFFSPVRRRPRWVPNSVPDKDIQLMHFLAWHHRFYKSAYIQKPLQGQALIIGGPPSAGKGFLSNGIVGTSAGGFSDGSPYLLGEDQWTADVLEKGLMTVDDDHSGDDMRSHRTFTTRLKRLVANTQAIYNKKFGSAGRVTWKGRIIITCNLDPESLRVLPDLTQSNADKIMIFLAQARKQDEQLPDFHTLDEIMARELPHYLRWLLEWEVPQWLLAGDERFWVRSYHHPTLLEAASEQGTVVNVLEMLREIYEEFVKADDEDIFSRGVITGKTETGGKSYTWTGPVRQLYKMMRRMDISQVDKHNLQQIGNMMGVLSSRGFKVTKLAGQNWRIVFDEALLSNQINDSLLEEHEVGEAND